MQHYRVYKLDAPKGHIIRGKDLHAEDDRAAMHEACADPECPVCEIWRGTKKVGAVE